MAKAWGIEVDRIPGKGLSAQELFQAKNAAKIRGMWVMASNPAISAAKSGEARTILDYSRQRLILEPQPPKRR